MERTYQIISIPSGAGDIVKMSDRCRSDFKRVTGVFFASGHPVGEITNTCRLTINGKEVLPKGTDIKLFLASEYVSRKEAMLDLDAETIEAENSPVEIEMEFNSATHHDVKLYLLLSKI